MCAFTYPLDTHAGRGAVRGGVLHVRRRVRACAPPGTSRPDPSARWRSIRWRPPAWSRTTWQRQQSAAAARRRFVGGRKRRRCSPRARLARCRLEAIPDEPRASPKRRRFQAEAGGASLLCALDPAWRTASRIRNENAAVGRCRAAQRAEKASLDSASVHTCPC